MSLDRVSKHNVNLDNEVIKIKDNQGNEQQVSLSVFVKGMAIAADTQSALSIFDQNNDGKINEEEANTIKQKIIQFAGKDKVLDDNEIKEMLSNGKNQLFIDKVVQQFKTMVERQFKGQLETTQKTNDGRTIVSNFNSDGSGVTKTTDSNGTVITCTYSAGKILTKKEVVNSEGRKTIVEYEYGSGDKPVKTTTKSYNRIGRLQEIKTVQNNYNKETGKLESSETKIKAPGSKERTLTTTYSYDPATGKILDENTEEITGKPITLPNGQTAQSKKTQNIHYDYDANGKIAKKTITKKPEGITITAEFANGKIQQQTKEENKVNFKLVDGKLRVSFQKSSSVMKYEYYENGKKKKVTIQSKDSYDKSSDMSYEYNENGKMTSAKKSYFKRGAYVEEKYYGPNLENRTSGGVANETVEYADAEKTRIQRRVVNIFDEQGILIGDEIYDGDGKKIGEHDFSKIDGKFDTAYQKGRGDCYLLAAINSLASSEQGEKLLQDTISKEGDNFVIKFPGAKIAREKLIKDLKAKNPNFDESKINIPDKYTITQEELKEAMLKSGSKYSIGDKDVLLLEIAYEKYRESVAVTLFENNLQSNEYMRGFSLNLDRDDYLRSGTGSEAIFILTGKTSEVYSTKDYDNTPVCYVDSDFQMHVANSSGQIAGSGNVKAMSVSEAADNKKLIEKLKKATADGTIQNYAATASFKVSSQEVNGKVIKDGNHALTIKSVTDKEVVLANPWNPDKDVVMSIEDFIKAAYRIEVADIRGGNNIVEEGHTGGNNSGGNVGTVNNPPHNTVVEQSNPEIASKYKVPKGKGFITLIKEKLVEQGIRPTKDNILKAKAQFKALNPGAVKVYNGSRTEWKGNEYLLQDAQVLIPKFKKDESGNVL